MNILYLFYVFGAMYMYDDCVYIAICDIVIDLATDLPHNARIYVILSLPLIQEGQLSVSGERMHKYWSTA